MAVEKTDSKKGDGEAKEKEFDAMPEFAKLTSSLWQRVHSPRPLARPQAAVAHDRSSADTNDSDSPFLIFQLILLSMPSTTQ
jgi:hypothetical protein